jgi:hypothetical protein
MPFDVATLSNLEEALSECFGYHAQLDTFLLRAGITKTFLDQARQTAEQRAKQSPKGYQRAPKRYVVQELLNLLSGLGDQGDKELAGVITGLLRGTFSEASSSGTSAIERLRAQAAPDRQERERANKEREAIEQEKERAADRAKQDAYLNIQRKKEQLRDRFIGLMSEANAQSRGYLFETFLNDFFAAEGLAPKSSFKIIGEQIDGSFSWRNRTYLVEAKWVKDPVAGSELGAFVYKTEGKTADTRGLYISVNGYSPQAIQGLNGKGSLKFVCIDGAHLMRAFAAGQSLVGILETAWRHADETGEAYLPINRFDG